MGEEQRENPKQTALLAQSLTWSSISWTVRAWPEQKSSIGCLTDCATQAPLLFIIFERERERQRASREGAEREGDTESEAGSRLWALRTEPDTGFKLTDCEIMTWGVVGAAQLTGPPRCPTAPQLYKCLLNLGFGSNQVKDSISLVILNFWEISGTDFPHLQGNFHTVCFSFGLQKPMVFKTLHLLWQQPVVSAACHLNRTEISAPLAPLVPMGEK